MCPASVLTNWERELAQWGAFRAAKVHGTTGSLAGAQDGSTEVTLTTFDTYRWLSISPWQRP